MRTTGNHGETVLEQWDDAQRRGPDALAVRDESGGLTRAELGDRSAELATALAERGIGRGDRVAVCVERSAALIVALLGVLRAGAAYVAIDPAYPEERIAWMLEDSAAAAIVGSPGYQQPEAASVSVQLSVGADGRLAKSANVGAGGGHRPRTARRRGRRARVALGS